MTFDATSGSATANSYATVAEADAYLAVRGDTSTWAALTGPQKEAKLQWAAIHLDTLSFLGTKAADAQALQWPRAEISGIPALLKNAQAEMAFQLISADWTQCLGPITQDSLKVGPIEFGKKHHNAFPAAVLAMLRPLLRFAPGLGGRVVRG